MITWLVVIFILGILAKFYHGAGASVIADKLAGMFYVTFWCIFFALIFNHWSPVILVIIVLTVTCLLEFTQLLTYPFLNMIRSTFTGRALIGSSFSWSDFPFYFLGAFFGFLILISNRKR
jgi:hypothetical protein